MNKNEAMDILKSDEFCKKKWELYKELTCKIVEKHDPCTLLLTAVDYLAEYQQWLVRLASEDETTLYKKFDPIKASSYHVMATVYIMVVDKLMEKYEDIVRMIEKTELTSLTEKYMA